MFWQKNKTKTSNCLQSQTYEKQLLFSTLCILSRSQNEVLVTNLFLLQTEIAFNRKNIKICFGFTMDT
ncbi:CLUMA_CG004874, isoform A [Clunio marinus]|uniref:CLUMA_CG004874, isoform A n=1 Tax=Clunio marinus TaxID=568069 RepID=A0A1J1HT05_9DIPT|nr:CLUMA_CG004874, isoform A [Clunio marinus]